MRDMEEIRLQRERAGRASADSRSVVWRKEESDEVKMCGIRQTKLRATQERAVHKKQSSGSVYKSQWSVQCSAVCGLCTYHAIGVHSLTLHGHTTGSCSHVHGLALCIY